MSDGRAAALERLRHLEVVWATATSAVPELRRALTSALARLR